MKVKWVCISIINAVFIAEPVNYTVNATVDVGDVNDNCPVFVEPVNISSKLNRTECFICLSPYNIKPFHRCFIKGSPTTKVSTCIKVNL